jgi:hypothetical protein
MIIIMWLENNTRVVTNTILEELKYRNNVP